MQKSLAGLRATIPAIIPAIVLLTATVGHAQGQAQLARYGGRVGLSSEPDQLTLGAFGTMAAFSPNVTFRPSGDLGIGSDVLTIIGNADLQYTFSTSGGGPVPFFGGGIGLLWFDPDGGSSDTELGLQIYGGVELAYRGYQTGIFEVRLGLDDEMPDLKLTYGFGFY